MLKKLMTTVGATVLLAACSAPQKQFSPSIHPAKLLSAYDYQLLDNQKRTVNLEQLLAELSDADAIFIGEYHKNHASHLLQSRILVGLHMLNIINGRETVLSMEMFERDQQQNLDMYLANKVGETYLINETPAWDNYVGSYRPLVEFAKQQQIPVVAANAPGDIVRCVGRQGGDYINKLDNNERALIAIDPYADVEGYAKRFFALMGITDHMPSNRMRNTYLAQLVRDNTMAESISEVLKSRTNSQVIHLNGTFHSEDGLGTAGAFKRLHPNKKVVVITPVHKDKIDNIGDDQFYYLIQKQPKEFVNDEYRNKAYKKMFSESKSKVCKS